MAHADGPDVNGQDGVRQLHAGRAGSQGERQQRPYPRQGVRAVGRGGDMVGVGVVVGPEAADHAGQVQGPVAVMQVREQLATPNHGGRAGRTDLASTPLPGVDGARAPRVLRVMLGSQCVVGRAAQALHDPDQREGDGPARPADGRDQVRSQ